MSSITTHMTGDHRHCDALFSDTESAVSQNNWQKAVSHWALFHNSIEQHFTIEEEILFPAFEQATGSSGGPTSVMRIEHVQMRQLFGQIAAAMEAKDSEETLGLTETLMILMQQHNMKEEQILYPMTDQVLPDATTILQQMEQSR
ncbi:MAG: hemerythrin domain-containing protein [Motiliproteus sp.]